MKEISRISCIVEHSAIRAMVALAAGKEDVVSFSIGEPDFTAQPHIVEAAEVAMRKGLTKYAPNAGIDELREAICRYALPRGMGDVSSENIVVTAGGMEALFLSMLVLFNPGDEVIIPDPCWVNYPQQIRLCHATPVYVPALERNGFMYDCDAVRSAITSRTKAILINSPSNPTGGVVNEATISGLAEIAKEYDLYVFSDEVYSKFIYDDQPHYSIGVFPGMFERTITINSFSKTYAMTGWRVGYVIAPCQLCDEMIKCQENVVSSVNTPAQYGAIAALRAPQEHIRETLEKYYRRRQVMVEGINSINGMSVKVPKGAFYVFANIRELGMSSETFAKTLLERESVIVVPGSAFGSSGEGFVRLSYATSEENIMRGIERMRRFANSVR